MTPRNSAVTRFEPRLPSLPPAMLNPEQLRLYEHIVSAGTASGDAQFRIRDRDGSLLGPFRAFLACPELGWAVHGLGEALLTSDRLPARIREAAVLTVAGLRSASYMQYAHEPAARAAGVPEPLILALRVGAPAPGSADRADDAIVSFTRELLLTGGVQDAAYHRARAILHETGVVHLVMLAGFFDLVASLLNAFRLGVPDPSP